MSRFASNFMLHLPEVLIGTTVGAITSAVGIHLGWPGAITVAAAAFAGWLVCWVGVQTFYLRARLKPMPKSDAGLPTSADEPDSEDEPSSDITKTRADHELAH